MVFAVRITESATPVLHEEVGAPEKQAPFRATPATRAPQSSVADRGAAAEPVATGPRTPSAHKEIPEPRRESQPSPSHGAAAPEAPEAATAGHPSAPATAPAPVAELAARPAETRPAPIAKNSAATVEPESPIALDPPKAEPLRNIALRLADKNQESVEVRLSGRTGDVRVAVHAADAQLSKDLRAGLGDLENRLERSGFQAETWKAGSTVSAGSESQSARDPRHSNGGQEHEGSGRRQPPRDPDEQPQSRRQKPRWLEEMNRRFEN